jgi:hypothetical protein
MVKKVSCGVTKWCKWIGTGLEKSAIFTVKRPWNNAINAACMKRILIAAVLFHVVAASAQQTNWPATSAESRPWTRWWWFGNAVDRANLSYNLEELAKAGIGGVEITPIYGVRNGEANYIEYLSPKWMEMLSHTIGEAERLGMKVDMNTGTGWPFGGPGVTVADAATKVQFKEYEVEGGARTELEITRPLLLYAFSDKGRKCDLTSLVDDEGRLIWDAPAGKWRLIALFTGKTCQQVKRAAPGGEGLVMDHFNPTAVKNYLSRFDDAFSRSGAPRPNAFFNDSYEVYGADWSPSLLDHFSQRRGYRLEEYLPELLGKGESDLSRRVVSDYRESVGEMLLENFTVPWTEWAHRHGATTRNQAHGSPANILDVYAAVDIPECEIFGMTDFNIPGLRKDSLVKINDGDPVTLKFASSAAHVAGKRYTSSETFTWLTEHFRTSLSQCKVEIDQLFTSGVNRVCFHGTPYSPRDAAWPGWLFYASANLSPTQPIWKDAPAFFSYINRVQSFLQYGEPDNDLLLYFPLHDIWYGEQDHFYFAFSIHGLRDKLPKFYQTVEEIRASGREVDYISDRFIRSSTVEGGRIKTSGGATYRALVLPGVKFMQPETLEKIWQLANEGATIIFIDHYPDDVPGLQGLETRRARFSWLISRFPRVDFGKTVMAGIGKGWFITGRDCRQLFEAAGIGHESFIAEYGGQLIRRQNETGYHYFFTMLTDNEIDGWVPLGVKARSAIFFNPMDGSSGKALLREHEGSCEVYMQLEPGESIILKTFTVDDVDLPGWTYFRDTGRELRLTDGWNLEFLESEPAIDTHFRLDSLVSWTRIGGEDTKRNMATGRYRIRFAIKKESGREYLLKLGDVRESARLHVNGREVGTLYAVPFTAAIGNYLVDGENLLEIDVTNLPANRISDYDRRGVEWRIFNDINVVDINYKQTLYDRWEPVPSGLLGPVSIKEVLLTHDPVDRIVNLGNRFQP